MDPASIGGASLAGAALLYWLLHSSSQKPPKIFVGDGPLKREVLPQCPVLQQPFRPSPLAANRHAQTVLSLFRKVTKLGHYTRQLVMTSDGGTIGLDWWQGSGSHRHYGTEQSPVLMVVHGVNGGSHEGYCKWACSAAVGRGWRAVVLNMRGCNGLKLTSARGYSATNAHDVHCAITAIKSRFPQAPIFAAGYSLGGILLTKYVAEADMGLHVHDSVVAASFEGSGLVAAAAVSTPVCLTNTTINLARPWRLSYMYNLAVAYKLREFIKEHRAEITGTAVFDVDDALNTWTTAEFDALVSPQFGFKDRHEYYEHASSLGYIPHIRTPTLFLISEDDPFLGVLPDQECAENPNTLLVATSHGGHVAFLQGLWPLGRAYMDDAVIQFMEAVGRHSGVLGSTCRASAAPPQSPEEVPAAAGSAVATVPLIRAKL